MIKRFTDNMRPVILGRVKIGQWIKGKAGERWDFFKIAKNERGPNGEVIEDLETTKFVRNSLKLKSDEKITRIPIYFSGNTIEEVYDSWYSLRWGTKSYCMGDGITAKRANVKVNDESEPRNGRLSMKTGDKVEIVGWLTVPCADSEQGCPYYSRDPELKRYCNIGSKLLFHIQGLTKRGGYFVFYNSSYHSTWKLESGLRAFEKMFCNHLSFIPFELVVERERTRQSNFEIHVVHLELNGNFEDIRKKVIETATIEMHFMKEMNKIKSSAQKLISLMPEDESVEEGEFHTQEYYGSRDIPADTKPVELEKKDDIDRAEGERVPEEPEYDDELPF